MGKEYGHKPSQVPAEQGLQISFEEPQMVKSLITILPANIEVVACLLLLECLRK